MKIFLKFTLCALLLFATVPAHADFKYTRTSEITGGSLKSMMKTVGFFSKEASKAMKPVTTTTYVKGDFLRTDDEDGTFRIIDLDGRRFIEVNPAARTWSEITFDQMKAAMDKAAKQMNEKMQQARQEPGNKDVKTDVNAKVYITPSAATREILGQTTKETKMDIELELQAQKTNPQPSEPAGPVSGTMVTSVDSWVAPSLPGYQEIGAFYARMAKEIDWTPPSNFHVDPRVAESMKAVQKNQSALRGLPLLQYISMSMKAPEGAAAAPPSQNAGADEQKSSSDTSVPTSASEAVVKGFGGLFGHKKKKEKAESSATASSNPPPPATPGALMEMTVEVNSFSNTALDSGLFAVPAGYVKVERDADQFFSKGPHR